MRRVGLVLEESHLPDEVYYALLWWGTPPCDALDASTLGVDSHRWAAGGAVSGSEVVRGAVVATDGRRALVVGKSTFPAPSAKWLTAVPAVVVGEVLLWKRRS